MKKKLTMDGPPGAGQVAAMSPTCGLLREKHSGEKAARTRLFGDQQGASGKSRAVAAVLRTRTTTCVGAGWSGRDLPRVSHGVFLLHQSCGPRAPASLGTDRKVKPGERVTHHTQLCGRDRTQGPDGRPTSCPTASAPSDPGFTLPFPSQ